MAPTHGLGSEKDPDLPDPPTLPEPEVFPGFRTESGRTRRVEDPTSPSDTMTTRRKRSTTPMVMELEGRLLMSGQGLTGLWRGQDGHDLVGPSSAVGGDDVQDIHIAVTGLPADWTV